MPRFATRFVAPLALALLSCAATSPALAQGVAQEGAVFLLIPVGARAAGQGSSGVASRTGPSSIWWNPAALAWTTKRDASADFSSNVAGDISAVSAAIPLGAAGVLGVGFAYFNYGDQDATDKAGNTVGSLASRSTVAVLSYTATFGQRVAAGISWKLPQQALSCSGACPLDDTFSVSTNAFDAGIQAVLRPDSSITVGAAATNIGFCLQVKDAEQCDPLPTRLHLGVEARLDQLVSRAPGLTLRGVAELATDLSLASPALRVGADLSVGNVLFLRGGLIGHDVSGNAVVGLGIRRGSLQIDMARSFGGPSADAGVPPTFVSIRFGLP